jgi:hypothetical protein
LTLPKAVFDAALRLKVADDKDGVGNNTLMIRASGGHSPKVAKEHLADLRLIYRYLLADEPTPPKVAA